MKEKCRKLLVPLAHIAGMIVSGYFALLALLWLFPPKESIVLAVAAVVVFCALVGVVAYLIVLIATPDGWAERGIWRFTLFGAGVALVDRRRHAKRIETLGVAGYTFWPLGRHWMLSPSIPRRLTLLARKWRSR